MAADDPESLENLLNKATSPFNRNEDWEAIISFCDQVNKELEGPQISVRLLAHKIQSPQERESLYALSTLEACVKNCGKRFHQEIGKFRFLNEVIKVVSPKYLGNHTSDKVKRRCIELMYSWGQGLKHEAKIGEAYSMLKRQGIVKEDPTYVEQELPDPSLPPRNGIFEDDEKSKVLARLLKSKHPEDLQAANRLIKNMVKQDAERMEKVSLRVQQLETIQNSVKLLNEMLSQYLSGGTTDSEREVMKELYDNLEKQRPNLFRLASNADDKDNDGINDILKANDEVMKSMNQYKRVVDGGDSGSDGLILMDDGPSADAGGSLVGLDLPPQNPPSQASSLLADQLAQLGLAAGGQMSEDPKDKYTELNDLFAASGQPAAQITDNVGLLDLGITSQPGIPSGGFGMSAQASAFPVIPPPAAPQPFNPLNSGMQGMGTFPAPPQATPMLAPTQPAQNINSSVFSTAPTSVFNQAPQYSQTVTGTNSVTGTPKKSAGLDSLDALGRSLLQQSMPAGQEVQISNSPAQKVPMNQMRPSAAIQPLPPTCSAPAGALPGHLQSLGTLSPVPTPPTSVTSSPAKAPLGSGETAAVVVQPLTDVTVPLASIHPGPDLPITVYEKNGLKCMIVCAIDRPRPDVLTAVVSTISTNTLPVKKFVFQAAVPKAMKVKLQPPSATDLPGFNPILPPAAITQVMLIANPQKEKIRLKFKVSYIVSDNTVTDLGDVDTFPLQ